MTGPNRLSALISVAEITLDDMPALLELEDLIKEVTDSSSKRTEFVHAYWIRNSETNEVYAVRQVARTGLETKISMPRAAEILAEARSAADLGFRLFDFVHNRNLMPPDPGPRPRGHKVRKKRKAARKRSKT